MTYERTQSGSWVAVVVGVLFVVGAVAIALSGQAATLGFVIYLVVGALVVEVSRRFSSLHVEVDDTGVTASFGSGWPSRTIAHSEIDAVEEVRNKWYYGLGLRYIPNGTMYNVGGLDAVELVLTTGKRFRIGTDDPEGLRAALEAQQT